MTFPRGGTALPTERGTAAVTTSLLRRQRCSDVSLALDLSSCTGEAPAECLDPQPHRKKVSLLFLLINFVDPRGTQPAGSGLTAPYPKTS